MQKTIQAVFTTSKTASYLAFTFTDIYLPDGVGDVTGISFETDFTNRNQVELKFFDNQLVVWRRTSGTTVTIPANAVVNIQCTEYVHL